MPGKLLEQEDNSGPIMQTTPKSARPVPVIRRSVNDPTTKPDMGRSGFPHNPYDLKDPSREPPTHTQMSNPHIKAAMTPEQDRRRFRMPSPSSPNYNTHLPPRPSPAVRPQSAMGLTSPPGGSGNYFNSYNNSYGKLQQQQQHSRPPTSLGLVSPAGGNRIIHQHSRSFGDGITSEHIYTDGMAPKHVSNDIYSVPPSRHQQEQQRNQMTDQNVYKPPQTARMQHSGPRGSYNPHYASNVDLNTRTDIHRDRLAQENTPHVEEDVPDLGPRKLAKNSTPANSSHDLRSAWQRLYGQAPESSSRRPSMDHLTHTNQPIRTEEAMYQISPRQENRSPQLGRDPLSQIPPRDKQVAGPMVTPFSDSGRQTPPGQCSNNQNVSPRFDTSHGPAMFSSPKPAAKTFRITPQDSHSLGPASKYPDPDMGLRTAIKSGHNEIGSYGKTKEFLTQSGRQSPYKLLHTDHNNESRESGLNRPGSGTRFTQNHAFCSDSENDIEDGPNILPTDSIFDYDKDDTDEDSIAQLSKTLKGSHPMLAPSVRNKEKDNHTVHLKEPSQSFERHQELKPTTRYARSRSLEDVRESGDESNLSFDVENTFLMVDPSDQSEMGTLRSKNSDVKTKLNRLEGMYAKVMKTLETNNPQETRSRRWSIGSSDTNSIRHQVHHSKHGRSGQRTGGREMKSVNKRFQRLESHVITLARSIAHISSELRTQNTMSREIENVKREIQELKVSGTERKRHDVDKYRGYNHPLNNPRQVNKLTRFFGQEPSWLEIFLTRLGYGQYVKNFDQEHIGMMELPYMTDDQLKSIGIPMGPRTRILQESQMCFKDDNFNIYIV